MTYRSCAANLGAAPILHGNMRSSAQKRRRAVLAATIGNTIEWYDFLVYSFMSVTIAKLFFPAGSELTSLFLSIATFGVGVAIRPIGAVALGIYADRFGRKAALILTIFLMAAGTSMITVAPTYEVIGIWAPLLIVMSRLLQGFSCGGELGGATAILVENAPPERRGLYASWQVASQAAAVLLAAAATMVVSIALTPAQLMAGGWRWPFALGLLIVPVGLYVRSKLNEPELFLMMRMNSPRVPIPETLRMGFGAMGTGIGISVLFVASAYILFLYMPTFATRQLGMPLAQAVFASTVGAGVLFLLTPIMGTISDRVGRKPMMLAGAVGFALLAYPAFMLITASPGPASLAFVQSVFAILMAVYGAPMVAALAELFPTRIRCTAVGLVYNLTVAFLGGTAQLIVTWLLAVTGNPLAPAFYVIAAAALSAVVVFAMRDRFREPLP